MTATVADAHVAHDLSSSSLRLLVTAGARADEADREGRLSPEVVRELSGSGFLRHFVPRRWGGPAGTFAEFTAGVSRVAGECASTAWCASLAASASRFAAYLPPGGQEEIWADGPDVAIAAVLVPGGSARPVPGGVELSGEFAYVSGVEHSEWVLLCVPGPVVADGRVTDSTAPHFYAVRREELSVRPTWDTVGMRATASHTAVAEEVTVPHHRAVPRADVVGGRSEHSDAPCHQAPFAASGGLTFLSVALGAADGAVRVVQGMAAERRSRELDAVVARAAGRTDAGMLLMQRAAEVLDHGPVDAETAARNGRDAAVAGRLAAECVADLVAAGGTRVLSASHPLQRIWRDVSVATSHVALRPEMSASPWMDAVLAPVDPVS